MAEFQIEASAVDYLSADDHGNPPAYFEVLGDVEKTIENLRRIRPLTPDLSREADRAKGRLRKPLTPALSKGAADRAKDREAMEKSHRLILG